MFWPAPPQTVTLSVTRPDFDSRGNRATPDPFYVQGVVSAQDAMTRPRLQEGSENRFIQDATLFVPRDTDVQPGDEIVYNGVTFTVAGHARGDQLHPFTGQDLGWMEFRMQGFG